MKVHYQGIDYNVYWKYLRYAPHKDFDKNGKSTIVPQKEYTECWVTNLLLDITIVRRAIKHKNDKFCKEVGRKMSLTRALETLFPNNKEARKTFWIEYFNRNLKIPF